MTLPAMTAGSKDAGRTERARARHSAPITEHNYLVQNVEDIPYVIKETFYLARS
jgi:hypothetical protein